MPSSLLAVASKADLILEARENAKLSEKELKIKAKRNYAKKKNSNRKSSNRKKLIPITE